MTAARAPALATEVVTKAELIELRDCQEEYKRAAKKADALEAKLELLQFCLVEKVLGLKSADELKSLPLEKVQRLCDRRQDQGLWELGEKAPIFTFRQTSHGRYPAWKELFIGLRGEAAAMRITNQTKETFSYRIEVDSPL